MEMAMDLRGVRCPLNWAKAKVRLETLARGDELTLRLDDERALVDLPRAAEAEGYVVGEPQRDGDAWLITITV